MKTLNISDIRAMNPCYDPNQYLKEDFIGTPVDILKNKDIPAKDRLWVCVRHTLLSDRQLHLYSLACARMSEQYTDDKHIKECNDVIERFINGKATKDELTAAWSAAEFAWSAAKSAWSAESAAESAWFAAKSAAWSAWYAAKSAAESAAWSATKEQQCETLIKILESDDAAT